MKLSAVYSNRVFSPHIRYVFDWLAENLGMDGAVYFSYDELRTADLRDSLLVVYGTLEPVVAMPHIHILESDFFSAQYLNPQSLPQTPLARWKDLPVLFGSLPPSGNWIEEREGKIISHADIIAGIFFLLTRYEEIVIKERDQRMRFPAERSLLKKEGLLERAIADEYADLFAEWTGRVRPDFRRKNHWGAHPFALYVTHDVDAVRKYSWKNLLTSDDKIRALSSLWGFMPDPYWTFEKLAETDEKFGIRADYSFLAGGSHPLDRPYSIQNRRIQKLIHYLKKRNFGIGIHFSLSAHLRLFAEGASSAERAESFSRELDCFNAAAGCPPVGSRQHYLGIRIPETWRQLDALGIPFDTTLGFSESPGFRCGTCRPFRCFDAETGRTLRLVEIPMIAMDASFIYYLRLSPAEALEHLCSLMARVERHGGVFCLLWHTHVFGGDYAGWGGVYRQFLETAACKNPFLGHPMRIWTENGKI